MFVRVPNHLADAGQGSDFFWRALRVTSGDYDLGFWVLAMDAANCGASVLIGGGRYGAGAGFGLNSDLGNIANEVKNCSPGR